MCNFEPSQKFGRSNPKALFPDIRKQPCPRNFQVLPSIVCVTASKINYFNRLLCFRSGMLPHPVGLASVGDSVFLGP